MEKTLERFRKPVLFSVRHDDTIQEARRKAALARVHHLPVMARGEVVGMICTCDMDSICPDAFVEERMHPPITLSFSHSWEDALELITECSVGSILLLEGETPQGIVTRGDLLNVDAPDGFTSEIPHCVCCGTTRHLRTNFLGKTLCVDCLRVPRGSVAHLTPVRALSPAY